MTFTAQLHRTFLPVSLSVSVAPLNVNTAVKLSYTHLSTYSFCVSPVCRIKITMADSPAVVFVSERCTY